MSSDHFKKLFTDLLASRLHDGPTFQDDYEACGTPGCRSGQIHIEGVAVLRGNDLVWIDKTGITSNPAVNTTKGTMIGVVLNCEDSHRYARLMAFHEGNVFRYCVTLGTLTGEPADIWRVW
jgi:hypothetical protein